MTQTKIPVNDDYFTCSVLKTSQENSDRSVCAYTSDWVI